MEYFFSRNFGGYIYTVDMIRFKCYLDNKELLNSIVNKLCFDNLNFWQHEGGFGKFLNNFKVDALWIGLGQKPSKSNNPLIFCMEFNPNKMTDKDWFYFYYFINAYNWHITRFDLAIDIPKNINQLLFTNISKRSYSIFFTNFNNKTYYFGKGDGHIKIYNKKIESSLDYELTRYEVTKEVDIDFHFPSEHLINFNFLDMVFLPYGYGSFMDSDETLDAIVYALNHGFPYKSLSRHYRKLIKHDLLGSYDLNDLNANCCFWDFIFHLNEKSRLI